MSKLDMVKKEIQRITGKRPLHLNNLREHNVIIYDDISNLKDNISKLILKCGNPQYIYSRPVITGYYYINSKAIYIAIKMEDISGISIEKQCNVCGAGDDIYLAEMLLGSIEPDSIHALIKCKNMQGLQEAVNILTK